MSEQESIHEQKLRKAWEKYGQEVGELVEKYDERFRRIVNKYGGGLDKDEIYSTLVMYSMPLYIENWKPHKQSDLVSWICYCIYLRILKHRSKVTNVRETRTLASLESEENNCLLGRFSSIEIIEDELYEELTAYEVYLLKTIAVDGYSVPAVARANSKAPETIRKDFKKTLAKCRRLLRES